MNNLLDVFPCNTLTYEDNNLLKEVVERYNKKKDRESYHFLLQTILYFANAYGEVPTPMVDEERALADIKLADLISGKEVRLQKNVVLTVSKVKDNHGILWVPLFTDEDEILKGCKPKILSNIAISALLNEAFSNQDTAGLIINPFGNSTIISKAVLGVLINDCKQSGNPY